MRLFHVHLVARVTDARNHLLQQAKVLLGLVVDGRAIGLGPGRDDQGGGRPARRVRLADTVQVLPYLFGDEGHEGVQQAHGLVKHDAQDTSRRAPALFVALHLHFGDFHVPVAVVRPEKLVDLAASLAKLELFDQARHVVCELRQAAEYPAIRQRDRLRLLDGGNTTADASRRQQHEARGVPDFVGEVAIAHDTLRYQPGVVAGRAAGCQREAQRVGAVLIHDGERVDHIVLRLAHLLALRIAHQAMQVNGMERLRSQEVYAGHRHARHPEEDDVVARLHHRGGIVAVQVGRVFGPAQRAERPQPRTEPCIKHIFVLMNVSAVTVRAGGNIDAADGHVAAIVAVPDGDAMPPPELARDAPVVNVVQPVGVDLIEAFRHDLHEVIVDRAQGRRCQRGHFDEPLFGDKWFDDGIRAVTVAQRHGIFLDLHDQAKLLQLLHQVFTRLEAVLPGVVSGLFGHLAVEADHLYARQVVAHPDLEVGRVVRGRDLDRAGAKAGVHRFIGDDGNFAPDDRQDSHTPDDVLIARVVWVDGHAGIAQDGLRARGRHADIARLLLALQRLERVAHVGQRSRRINVVHLQVGDGAHAEGTPVDDALAAIDQPFFVQAHEHFAHGLR